MTAVGPLHAAAVLELAMRGTRGDGTAEGDGTDARAAEVKATEAAMDGAADAIVRELDRLRGASEPLAPTAHPAPPTAQ